MSLCTILKRCMTHVPSGVCVTRPVWSASGVSVCDWTRLTSERELGDQLGVSLTVRRPILVPFVDLNLRGPTLVHGNSLSRTQITVCLTYVVCLT